MGHETITEPEVGADYVNAAKMDVGFGSRASRRTRSGAFHMTPAELEVTHLATSWIPAGTKWARGLISPMGTTCIGIGGSRVWRGKIT